MVWADNPLYFPCPGRLWASPRDIPFPAFGWAGAPIASLQLCSSRMPLGSSVGPFTWNQLHLRVTQCHVSPVYASLETSHAYPETSHAYPETYIPGSCCCCYGGISVGHSLLPGSVFQYSIPACGWPPMPAGEPLWPLRGPHHVGHLSPRTWIGILVGRWARRWLWQPPIGLPPAWQCPLFLQAAPQGGQDVLDGLFPPLGPAGQWAGWPS